MKDDPVTLTAPEALLQKLAYPTDLPADTERMRSNINLLDESGSFSTTANTLLAKGTATPESLALWVSSDYRTRRAIARAAHFRSSCGIKYNAAQYVLEDATLLSSMDRFGLISNDNHTDPLTQARDGKELLFKTAPDLRPDLLASSDTLDRYYHPLNVAAQTISPLKNVRKFRKEAPAFIAWAMEYENLPTLLAAALKAGSLKRGTIEEYMLMVKETEPALRSGLL